MIYLKQTVAKVKDRIFSQKMVQQLQNSFLFQLVVLSSIKGYLYKAVAEQQFFIVPEHIKKSAAIKKKILVLDMDETLVYTRRESKPDHRNFKVVKHEGSHMYIQQRPHLSDFLTAVSTIFQIFIYTAGNKEYADAVLDQIDKNKVIKRRFYRECCKKENGNYYKDLKHLKKVSKINAQMILVDDNGTSIGHNYPFAVKVKEFEGDQKDKQLLNIFKNLLKFYL